ILQPLDSPGCHRLHLPTRSDAACAVPVHRARGRPRVDQGPPSPRSPRGGSVEDMDDIATSSGNPRLDGVRVLIVDDDDGIRFAVRMLLEQSGAIVTAAPSAEAALVLLRQERPDVLLSDLTMPT